MIKIFGLILTVFGCISLLFNSLTFIGVILSVLSEGIALKQCIFFIMYTLFFIVTGVGLICFKIGQKLEVK